MKGAVFLISMVMFVHGVSQAQLPTPALVGYWHNWNDGNAPYIALDNVDDRYNVIEVAFAVPTSPTDMTMVFAPDVVAQNVLITQIQTLHSQGKKVLISVGGATATIDLTTLANRDAFVSSMNGIINTYGFDGIDIDIESGSSVLITGGTMAAPANVAQVHLIEAIRQIMSDYYIAHGQKLLLTMAPETAYVQGGQSGFGGIWGGYLPIIDALRDSLDLLQVQLYNSGSMYGIDGNIYTQGTADFIVAMTEAVIQGFNTSGGFFAGLPAHKVAVGLPACPSAAGGGYVDGATLAMAVNHLLGNGPQPGSYVLDNANGHPTLRGLMTWSVNWDAATDCGGAYTYADAYTAIFQTATATYAIGQQPLVTIYPNPASTKIHIHYRSDATRTISVLNALGQTVASTTASGSEMVLPIGDLPYGVYTLLSSDGKNRMQSRFMKE